MGTEGMESEALLRDQEPLVKNTTNRMKDLFLLRAESSSVPSRREKTSSGHLHRAPQPFLAAAFAALPQ